MYHQTILLVLRDVHGVMVISVGNGHSDSSSSQTILPTAMGKLKSRLDSLTLVWQLISKKEKLWIQTRLTSLKN